MASAKKGNTTPRSRRSNINLADLRVAPLTAVYTEASQDSKVPAEEGNYDLSFSRSHSSYIQGKSAPTSPGILSRSSSRKSLGGGLRRTSIYDNDIPGAESYDYAGSTNKRTGTLRAEVGSGQIPKAKSEAALLVERSRRAGKGANVHRQYQHHARSRTGDPAIPRSKSKLKQADEDWLARTGATAGAFLQESKGQSWIASRTSSTSLTHLHDTTDEEDEGYEELAAQSASASRRNVAIADDELYPGSTRVSRWGSRYGSRTGSRRTSRRGSVTLTAGQRTPLPPLAGGQDGNEDYFEDATRAMAMKPAFVDDDDDDEDDEEHESTLKQLTETTSFGLGGLMDRIMRFSLFNVEEREEGTEDETERTVETEEEAKERRAADVRRKREEKEKLTTRASLAEDEGGNNEEKEGGWADAAWLFSVASKAIF